ncbi:MAG: hypothetical protein COA41_01675 [Sphingopyxis sp.]|nr:MAG: hypothetical protein COA41_01675 [Sphingopyxis sp.]
MMNARTPLIRNGDEKPAMSSADSDLKLFVAVTLGVFASTLFFYGFIYSLHQDLAGGALSGSLAVALGDSFREYSIYFPPVEKFWFSLAVRLSDLTGLRLDLAIVAMTDAMVLVAATIAYQIRRATVGASPIFFILSVAVLITLPILFKNVFGLREHIVALGLWPYLVLRFSDPEGARIDWRLRLLLGLWVGATLLFKYVYSAVVILVELADSLMQRQPALLFRVENITSGMVVFLYLFVWLGLDPSQRDAIGAMMNSIDANLLDTNENSLKLIHNLLPACLLLFASWYSGVPGRSSGLAVATVLATLIAAWSQERWYTHHLLPITMAYIAWWWLAARNFRWYFNVAAALLILLPIAGQFVSTRIYQAQSTELEEALEDGGITLSGKRVAILTMHPSPYNQYLASHGAMRWNPMMNNAYVAAELKPFDKPAIAASAPPLKLDNPGRKMLHDQMLRLWEDFPPDVLILDGTHRWPLRYIDVDWAHVFSEDPRFKAIFSKYRREMVYNGKRIKFTYYVRAD